MKYSIPLLLLVVLMTWAVPALPRTVQAQAASNGSDAFLPAIYALLLKKPAPTPPQDSVINIVVTAGGLVTVTDVITLRDYTFFAQTTTDVEAAFPGIIAQGYPLLFSPTAEIGYMFEKCALPDGSPIPNFYVLEPYKDITCSFVPNP